MFRELVRIKQQMPMEDCIELLKNEANFLVSDFGQFIFCIGLDGQTVQQIASGVGNVQTTDDIHHGGFAGTGGTNDADKFMGPDMQ